MATFDITAPSGEIFEINAPEGATDDQVLEYAKTQFESMQPRTVAPVIEADGLPSAGQTIGGQQAPPPQDQPDMLGKYLDAAGNIIRGGVGGLAAGATELIGMPISAYGGVEEFVTGKRPAYADIPHQQAEAQRKAIAGEALETPEGRIASTAGEFAAFGGGIRGGARQIGKGVEQVTSRAPITTDVAVGGTYQGAKEAGFGEVGAFGLSLVPALLLGKAPKSDQITHNKVEKEWADSIRNVRGSIDKAIENGELNAQSGMETSFSAMLENPTIGASVKALAAKSTIFGEFVTDSFRRFQEAVKIEGDAFRVGGKAADEALNASRKAYQGVIDDALTVHKKVLESGAATEAEAAQALHAHLAILEEGAHVASSAAYKAIDMKQLGSITKPATGRVMAAVDDALKLGTVKESDRIMLSQEVRNLNALVQNEIGTKVIPAKIKELPSGKKIVLKRERTVGGKENISVEALNDIRSEAMSSSRAMKTANGGPNDMTRRLDKVVTTITDELEKFPALKNANAKWKSYKNTFHDGQIATFFATRGSGVEKTAAERIHAIFIKGTEADRNAAQVKEVFATYDKDGKMKNNFIADLKHAFDTSLAAKMEGKERLTANEWSSWIRQNKKSLDAYDKHLGTNLRQRYGKFRDATNAAQDASKSMAEIEGLSFSQEVGGNLHRKVKSSLANGTLNELVESMPTKFLKDAVTKRAASDLIDMEKNILNPQALADAALSNKETLILGLGEKSYKRIEGVTNAIRQEAAQYSGAPIESVRTQLLKEGEAVKRTINLATAVIGSIRRRGFKIAQVWDDVEKGRLMIEAFEAAMTSPKAYRRIMAAAEKDPKLIKNMWLLSTIAPVKELGEQ